MAIAVNNYINSVIQFDVNIDKCIPSFDYCLPAQDLHLLSAEITGVTSEFIFQIPLPCDTNFADVGFIFNFEAFLLTYGSGGVLDNIQMDNYTGDFYHTNQTPVSLPNVSSVFTFPSWTDCYCYFIISADYTETAPNVWQLNSWNAEAKSQCIKYSTDCNTIRVQYSNNQDSLGLPYISGFSYSTYVDGMLWKPTIKSDSKTYLKSNNELIVVSSVSGESWELDANLMNYYDIRNLSLALKSDNVFLDSGLMYQLNNYVGTGTLGFYLEEDPTITYPRGCYASGRALFKLRRKIPIGMVNYNC